MTEAVPVNCTEAELRDIENALERACLPMLAERFRRMQLTPNPHAYRALKP